tara:strand:+ start:159 stop:2084 length:1926 start_codon:yes stop_codon:yes gene_type:complete
MIEIKLIEKALLIRRFEELLLKLFKSGKLNGTIHTCIGQEFIGVAISEYLNMGDSMFSNHRGHGHFIAFTGNVEGLLSEIMGKANGVCGGIGGSQHIYYNNFYSNGILGGMVPVAAGHAYAHKIKNDNNISVIFVGDGALGEGVIYESLNIVSVWNIPLLIVVERNGYAQSTNTKQTLAGTIEGRANAFNIKFESANTWDIENLLEVSKSAINYVREESKPLILQVETYRLEAHSKGDDNRNSDEIDRYREKDYLNKLICSNNEQINEIDQRVDNLLQDSLAIAEKSLNCSFVKRSFYDDKIVTWRTLTHSTDRYSNLLYKCLKDLFSKNEKILMIGEDIEGDYGGAFKITRDLSSLFPGRVRNTPISEGAITGLATGLSLGGFLPIVEIMFGDFLTLTLDQLMQHASKFELMYNGKVKTPMIIRTPMGGRRGYGPTHSQSIEGFFLGIPNLQIIALNIRVPPQLIYSKLFSECKSPTLVIENKVTYTRKLKTEEVNGFAVEFSNEIYPTVRIRPKGINPQITIVCYGGMLELVEDAVNILFDEYEIICEVISVTRLVPMNILPLEKSVNKTRRILIVEEGKTFASWGSEVLSSLCEIVCNIEKSERIGNDQLVPSAFLAEQEIQVNTDQIVETVNRMLNE